MAKKKKNIWLIIGMTFIVLVSVLVIAVFFFLQSGKNSDSVKAYKLEIETQTQEAIVRHTGEVEQATAQIVEALSGKGAEGSGTEGSGEGLGVPSSAVSEEQLKLAITEALKEKYYAILEVQKAEAIAMVENLVSQGMADYNQLVASGQKTPTTLGSMVSEYMAKVDTMEAGMDSSFNATVEKMREQFKGQGIEAEPIIAEYQAEYKRIKEANRQAFMDKAWSAIN